MKELKDILREARIKQGKVLREVASATGIDQTIINKFELGERKPSRKQLEKLAKFYDLDIKELIIAWKSDMIFYDLKDEKLANEILKVTEQKIKYIKKHK